MTKYILYIPFLIFAFVIAMNFDKVLFAQTNATGVEVFDLNACISLSAQNDPELRYTGDKFEIVCIASAFLKI